MIMLFYHFRLKLDKQEDGKWYRRATNTHDIDTPETDDCIYAQYSEEVGAYRIGTELVLPITTLKQVKAYCRSRVLGARTIFVCALLGVIGTSICAAMEVLRFGTHWQTFVPLAVMSVLCVLMGPQAFNPVAHDVSGHWINLRTGATNLNGGCVIGNYVETRR